MELFTSKEKKIPKAFQTPFAFRNATQDDFRLVPVVQPRDTTDPLSHLNRGLVPGVSSGSDFFHWL